MASLLDEQQQWLDSSGTPLVGGFIYIGDQNADPVLNPKAIFSDRELTTPLSQPQTIDANGRTSNKVWTDGRYSIEVQDLNAVQVYSELDNGEGTESGITTLDNVLGANTITADGSPAITAYVDKEQYVFTAAQINTGAVTLNIDSIGAKSVLKNHTEAIAANDFEEDQVIIVVYNLVDDVFEWTNQSIKTATDAEISAGTETDGRIVSPFQVNLGVASRKLLQKVVLMDGVYASGANVLPGFDDTIPQLSETNVHYPQAFTPKSASSTILITGIIALAYNNTGAATVATLHKDNDADAIGVSAIHTNSDDQHNHTVIASETSGSLTSRTYKLGLTSNAATKINGNNTTRLYGGALRSGLIIEEWAS